MFNEVVAFVNNILWGDGQLLIVMLLGAGVWFSVRLQLIQLRYFTRMFVLTARGMSANASGISPFQALCTSLSARVGTGNLAGVAIAIALGGPGAVFWMWVIAFIGMATGYAESLLAQVYKVRDRNGEFRGGPAYYIKWGLGLPSLGVLFSLCLLFGYGFIFGATQANTIADALNYAYAVPAQITGWVIISLVAIIVILGVRAIARFAAIAVPFMALAYLLLAVWILLLHWTEVPAMLYLIVSSAFGLNEAAAGTVAVALQQGVQRGLYSNEAGAGSAPQAAASAAPEPNHPATQGFVQMLGVFVDTMVVCTCTAVVILLAQESTGLTSEGIRLTQMAMSEHIGAWGVHFVALAITLFAFTSIVANFVYAEANLHLLKLDSRAGRAGLIVIFLTMIFWGTGAQLRDVWAAADMAFGLMALINIVAIVALSPTVRRVTQDFLRQDHSGLTVSFKPSKVGVQGSVQKDVWAD